MDTKYKTGQAVMVPAIIRAAVERDGTIAYEVEIMDYRVPESDIEESPRALAAAAMKELERNMRERWG